MLSSQAVRNGLFAIRPLCLKQEIKLMWTALRAEQRCVLSATCSTRTSRRSGELQSVFGAGEQELRPPSATGIVYDEVKL